jgi:hypothetical protein
MMQKIPNTGFQSCLGKLLWRKCDAFYKYVKLTISIIRHLVIAFVLGKQIVDMYYQKRKHEHVEIRCSFYAI